MFKKIIHLITQYDNKEITKKELIIKLCSLFYTSPKKSPKFVYVNGQVCQVYKTLVEVDSSVYVWTNEHYGKQLQIGVDCEYLAIDKKIEYLDIS